MYFNVFHTINLVFPNGKENWMIFDDFYLLINLNKRMIFQWDGAFCCRHLVEKCPTRRHGVVGLPYQGKSCWFYPMVI